MMDHSSNHSGGNNYYRFTSSSRYDDRHDYSSPRRTHRSSQRGRSRSGSGSRSRSRSPSHSRSPTRNRHRLPIKHTESEKAKQPHIHTVKVWSSISYSDHEVGRGYAVGVGLQFDDTVGHGMQAACHWLHQPAHYAEMTGFLMTFAALKALNKANTNVTIYTNTPTLQRMILDPEAYSDQSYGDLGERITFHYVREIINNWKGQVNIACARDHHGRLAELGLRLAKSYAVEVRKSSLRTQLRPIPNCMLSTDIGKEWAARLALSIPATSRRSLSATLRRTTMSKLLNPVKKEKKQTTPPPTLAAPAPSTRPPVTISPNVDSESSSHPPRPAGWPSSLPFPLPFDISAKLISHLVSFTALPTPRDMREFQPTDNPLVFPQAAHPQAHPKAHPQIHAFTSPPPPVVHHPAPQQSTQPPSDPRQRPQQVQRTIQQQAQQPKEHDSPHYIKTPYILSPPNTVAGSNALTTLSGTDNRAVPHPSGYGSFIYVSPKRDVAVKRER